MRGVWGVCLRRVRGECRVGVYGEWGVRMRGQWGGCVQGDCTVENIILGQFFSPQSCIFVFCICIVVVWEIITYFYCDSMIVCMNLKKKVTT